MLPGLTPKKVAAAMQAIGAAGYVGQHPDAETLVLSEALDSLDPNYIAQVPQRLSEELQSVVMVIASYDSELFILKIYENGEELGTYHSGDWPGLSIEQKRRVASAMNPPGFIDDLVELLDHGSAADSVIFHYNLAAVLGLSPAGPGHKASDILAGRACPGIASDQWVVVTD